MSKIVSNKNQLARLVERMEENPNFAKGVYSKPLMSKKWLEIAVELNSLGPPQRDSANWQRVWADLKSKPKKKKTQNKIEIVATGGGPNKLYRLTDTKEAVSALMHFDSSVDPPGTEFGLELPSFKADDNDIEIIDLQQDVEVSPAQQKVPTRRPLKEKNDIDRLKLLENQTTAQDKFYSSMVEIMNSVQQNISKIKKSLSNIDYYTKKNYDLKKEKLHLQKEKLEFKKEYIKNKENDRKMKLKLKLQILEIEKKKLELKNNF